MNSGLRGFRNPGREGFWFFSGRTPSRVVDIPTIFKKRKRGGGINWESGINRLTTIYEIDKQQGLTVVTGLKYREIHMCVCVYIYIQILFIGYY